MMSERMEPERTPGLAAIQDTCSVSGCGDPAVAVTAATRHEDEEVLWLWFCDYHATDVVTAVPGAIPQPIRRTCGVGREVTCGATASHVAIVAHLDDRGHSHLGWVASVSGMSGHGDKARRVCSTERVYGGLDNSNY